MIHSSASLASASGLVFGEAVVVQVQTDEGLCAVACGLAAPHGFKCCVTHFIGVGVSRDARHNGGFFGGCVAQEYPSVLSSSICNSGLYIFLTCLELVFLRV
jgi:hypothetical protein